MKQSLARMSVAAILVFTCWTTSAQEVQSRPVVEVGSAPVVEVQSRPVVEVGSAPVVEVQSRAQAEARDATQAINAPSDRAVDLSGFMGVWQTAIPGAVWQTPSDVSGYNVLHMGVGASGGRLQINKDGTYTWASYGGKKGRWVLTGEGLDGYPLALVDTVEKKRWKVGVDNREAGKIWLWDGEAISYHGRRVTGR